MGHRSQANILFAGVDFGNGLAGERTNASWLKPDSAYWASIQMQVNALSPSYVSKTTMLNPYRIFAVQHRKDWLLVVSDSLGFDSYLKLHKTDTLHQNSLFFDSNLGALLGQYIQPSPKPRPVSLGEIAFENFYEVLREGRDFF
ncbi:MAG: hypothetical protein HC913_05210 [Microscillaceae bacterium]|nr:hypothetical protein [Microscillaceae bacterium]